MQQRIDFFCKIKYPWYYLQTCFQSLNFCFEQMYQLCLFSNKNPTGVYIMMGSNYYLFQYSIDVKQNNYGNKKINRSNSTNDLGILYFIFHGKTYLKLHILIWFSL